MSTAKVCPLLLNAQNKLDKDDKVQQIMELAKKVDALFAKKKASNQKWWDYRGEVKDMEDKKAVLQNELKVAERNVEIVRYKSMKNATRVDDDRLAWQKAKEELDKLQKSL